MPIYEFKGMRPRIPASTYVHPTAVIIGDVVIGENCFILPHVTLRGDAGRIELGDGSNIQDNCVLHGGCTLGKASHVGHGAIIHEAKLGDNILVGMGSVILDYADVGDKCIIGAGAVVPPRMVIPSRKIVMGVPATITGDVTPDREPRLLGGAKYYEDLGRLYTTSVREMSREEAVAEAVQPGKR